VIALEAGKHKVCPYIGIHISLVIVAKSLVCKPNSDPITAKGRVGAFTESLVRLLCTMANQGKTAEASTFNYSWEE